MTNGDAEPPKAGSNLINRIVSNGALFLQFMQSQ